MGLDDGFTPLVREKEQTCPAFHKMKKTTVAIHKKSKEHFVCMWGESGRN